VKDLELTNKTEDRTNEMVTVHITEKKKKTLKQHLENLSGWWF